MAPSSSLLTSTSRVRLLVVLSLVAVSVIWGSTYFAIKVALPVYPPFTMGAIRFLVAGGALFALLRLRGEPGLTLRQWAAAAFTGVLFFVVANGFIAVAERSVSSGVAAIVVATMPLWAALFGRFFGARVSKLEALGLLVGFAGVVVLNGGGELLQHGWYALAMLVSPVAWGFGSIVGRKL